MWKARMSGVDPAISIMVHNHTNTSSMEISALAVVLRTKNEREMAQLVKRATISNDSRAPGLMKACMNCVKSVSLYEIYCDAPHR